VEEFIAANDEITREYRAHGATQALEFFLARLMGSDWRTELDRHIPGAVDQVERDADTFFTSDIPALLAWEFDANKARALHQPTLYIGGTDSGAWFAEERNVILDWLPEAEDVAIPGADHNLAVTHSQRIAGELVDFIARHPIGLSPPGTRGA
jgi:pimeloyl-ACP methyl ester carboxylesterase